MFYLSRLTAAPTRMAADIIRCARPCLDLAQTESRQRLAMAL